MLSRVNASRPIAPIQSGSQPSPRSSARIAAPSATISSARPQLSVSGNDEWCVSGGSSAAAAATVAASAIRKRRSSSPKSASTAAM